MVVKFTTIKELHRDLVNLCGKLNEVGRSFKSLTRSQIPYTSKHKLMKGFFLNPNGWSIALIALLANDMAIYC